MQNSTNEFAGKLFMLRGGATFNEKGRPPLDSLDRGAVKQLKLIEKRGSPLPNVGEGLGVRGNSTTHLSPADPCLARVFDLW